MEELTSLAAGVCAGIQWAMYRDLGQD